MLDWWKLSTPAARWHPDVPRFDTRLLVQTHTVCTFCILKTRQVPALSQQYGRSGQETPPVPRRTCKHGACTVSCNLLVGWQVAAAAAWFEAHPSLRTCTTLYLERDADVPLRLWAFVASPNDFSCRLHGNLPRSLPRNA